MTTERFTINARRVIIASQEEARSLKHNHIGSEHLLLGLFGAPDSTAAKVLHDLGYTKDTARTDITAMVPPGTEEQHGHIPFAPDARKILESAGHEAQQLQHNHIGTEHLLLALVRESERVGARALAQRITPISKIRAALLGAVEGSRNGRTTPWPTGTPATEDTVLAASALAGGAPLGSHHLLEAMLRTENSMAARVLRELGVDPAAVAAKIDELDPDTTTDATPEETAARKMEIRLVDDEVHLILRDPATVAIATKITELSDGPIRGVGPVAGMFVPLWRSTNQLLARIQRLLEPAPGQEGESAASGVATVVRAVLAPRLRRQTD